MTVEEAFPNLDNMSAKFRLPIVVTVIAVVLCIVSGLIARLAGLKRRNKLNVRYDGSCCKTGCCSAYALKGWSLATYIACIFLLAASLTLYVAMDKVAKNIGGILDSVLQVKGDDLKGTPAEEALSNVDDSLTFID